MIGKLFEHLRARLMLAVLQVGRDVDPLGRLAGAIFECIFEREVDEAADLLAVPDRNLRARSAVTRSSAGRGQEVADSSVRLVDPVDEDEVRDPELVERAQGRGRERGPRWIGIDDDDGDVGDRQRLGAIGGEADRSGAIEKCERVAEIIEIVEVEFGRAAA